MNDRAQLDLEAYLEVKKGKPIRLNGISTKPYYAVIYLSKMPFQGKRVQTGKLEQGKYLCWEQGEGTLARPEWRTFKLPQLPPIDQNNE